MAACLASLQTSVKVPSVTVRRTASASSAKCIQRVALSQRYSVVAKAAGTPDAKVANESESELDDKILPYCDISKKQKKTLGEMEQEFLLALQAFYIGQDPIMSNEEFDILKENLTWEGSSVVVLSKEEQTFMEASFMREAGKSFMSDEEYEALKDKLKRQGSKVAAEGPRCSLRDRKVFSDSSVDYLRMTALNVPAALVALAIVFLFDDISGFEITYLLELPEPWSFIFTWFVVLPFTFVVTQRITNFFLKDFLILQGPCPNCGHNNISFFGTILTVSTGQTVNEVKCEDCGSTLSYDMVSRRISLESLPPLKPAAGAKVAAR